VGVAPVTALEQRDYLTSIILQLCDKSALTEALRSHSSICILEIYPKHRRSGPRQQKHSNQNV